MLGRLIILFSGRTLICMFMRIGEGLHFLTFVFCFRNDAWWQRIFLIARLNLRPSNPRCRWGFFPAVCSSPLEQEFKVHHARIFSLNQIDVLRGRFLWHVVDNKVFPEVILHYRTVSIYQIYIMDQGNGTRVCPNQQKRTKTWFYVSLVWWSSVVPIWCLVISKPSDW